MITNIFIFSTGMRTGSTLIQRILNSIDHVMIWGEQTLHIFEVLRQYYNSCQKTKSNHLDIALKNGLNQFIPHLSPDPQFVLECTKNYLDNIYKKNTNLKDDINIWGAKFINGNKQIYEFIKSLYPNSRFIFLTRHPFDVYKSLHSLNWDIKTNFHKFWVDVTSEFHNIVFSSDNWYVLKYENLCDKLYDCLDFLELEYNKNNINKVLSDKLHSSSHEFKGNLDYIHNFFQDAQRLELLHNIGYKLV